MIAVARLDLSLTPEELGRYLAERRTVRLATASPEGAPHVVPLWFVWHDGAVFMNTTLGNRTVRNLESNPVAAALVDDGEAYDELRGVVLRGRIERADSDPRLEAVEGAWSRKYLGGGELPYERWHGRIWLRLDPGSASSWDFRKIPDARRRAGGD